MRTTSSIPAGLALLALLVFPAVAPAQVVEEPTPPPPALSTVLSLYGIGLPFGGGAQLAPTNLATYVKDEQALARLGKAWFWDMQAGSDGLTACASCHFHAGVDSRARSQFHPGPNGTFQGGRPNAEATKADFPRIKLRDPDNRHSVWQSSDDVTGSQGVVKADFLGLLPNDPDARDDGQRVDDAIFQAGGKQVRQVTGRNAPTVINAAFNYQNFWDGRAHNEFNGVSPFGPRDAAATVHVVQDGVVVAQPVSMDFASLASQAVGPIGSEVEMAFAGRGNRDLGRKLLPLPPLAKQLVRADDSLLGGLSASPDKGLAAGLTYRQMVQDAFNDPYWDSVELVDGYSLAESNFTFFWGLALQAYMRTLVSDDSRYDRVQLGQASFTQQEQRGLDLFLGEAGCIACHLGPEFTSATSRGIFVEPPEPGDIPLPFPDPAPVLENMAMRSGRLAIYDVGFYNVGVRPTQTDIGRGATDPWGTPLSWALTLGVELGADPANTAVAGAYKTPSLRNVELTGPYMHDGSAATLKQAVDFYARGSDFFENNLRDLSPEIGPNAGGVITTLVGDEADKDALVAFLLTLTDERVRDEAAPFDHPQLMLPDGMLGDAASIPCTPEEIFLGNCDDLVELPAVGAAGRTAQGLSPIDRFLGLDPFDRAATPAPPVSVVGATLLMMTD